MKQIVFQLETLTPMFMSGADQGKFELRPSSFKGLLRFWWRAMQEERNIECLIQKEAKLFGGTQERQGKSPVRLRFVGADLKNLNHAHRCYLLPHKSSVEVRALKPQQTFTCLLDFSPPAYQNTTCSALKLAVLAGGFGKRSRRGFGALAYRTFQTTEEFSDEILQVSSTLSASYPLTVQPGQRHCMTFERTISTKTPEYPRIMRIALGTNGKAHYDTLLEKIGKATHKHRDNSLGNGKPRMASPVIVSIVKIGTLYHPIITTVTSHFPKGAYPRYDLKKQADFINAILS